MRFIKNTIPEIVQHMKEDRVDVVLLIPFWPVCPQTVGLVQKACEEVGMSCSTISIIDEITKKLKIHRYFSVPYELGHPLGAPDDFENQMDICKKALSLIQ